MAIKEGMTSQKCRQLFFECQNVKGAQFLQMADRNADGIGVFCLHVSILSNFYHALIPFFFLRCDNVYITVCHVIHHHYPMGYTPPKPNMEPENTLWKIRRTSTNHQFLGHVYMSRESKGTPPQCHLALEIMP